jgi:hypothetical protein
MLGAPVGAIRELDVQNPPDGYRVELIERGRS